LEDQFDGANRKHLRRFIFVDEKDKPSSSSGHTVPALPHRQITATSSAGATAFSFPSANDIDTETTSKEVEHALYLLLDGEKEEKRELSRLPTCAVFHKLSAGRGVPHTFYGMRST